jgi:ABC-type cobalt transport system substrate-binding protein
MPILELFILTVVLIVIVVLALSVRMIFTKKGEFRGGSCQSHPDKLKDQGIGCGCGGGSCETSL